ncbi:hypothetical protein [Nocardia sp. NPDC059239]|uniref:hypothetical protein n=1 Tax=unclassified Nocardia TaxID=2637762 RepID=UPI00369376B4
MTHAETHTDPIAHIDHNPACTGCGKRATFWADAHGCTDGFICDTCLADNRKNFERTVARRGRIGCVFCVRFFNNFDTWIKVVPL